MNAALSPDSVINDLPGWRGATWKQLAGGLTNQTWLLEKSGRKAVLKIDDQLRSTPFNTRFAEATVQTTAARAGLAAGVIFADNQIYLCDYIEGDVWDKGYFDVPENIERVASALKRLHGLPQSGRLFDSVAAAKGYATSISRDDKFVGVCFDIIENTEPSQTRCFCHNDLVAENIVATPDIKFLDWEYARDNDPLYDLATIIEHHELNREQTQRLADAYIDGCRELPYERLTEQRRLYLALYWLWLASRPDSQDEELVSVAMRLTTSYS